MSIRNIDAILKPKSIAVVGASSHAHSIGNILIANLLEAGFAGGIFPVNPAHDSINGIACYADVGKLPETPDLAVICSPARTVPNVVSALGKMGTKGVIVISAGFKEVSSQEGMDLQKRLLEAAQPHLIRIVGPNCLGALSTPSRLNASFAHLSPQKGGVAFVTQSGAMLTTVLDWAAERNIGFSHMLSLGDMADVDFGDMLNYLAEDKDTKTIFLYVEAITHAQKFVKAARAAALHKPVIVLKAGRHAAAAKAASSHTGALAGADEVYEAAFKKTGLLRVYSLEELFDAVEILAHDKLPGGNRIAVLTNGGGTGVLATDAFLDVGATLATLSDTTIAMLDSVLPKTWSRSNPVDIIGDATPERYSTALKLLLAADEIDWILVQNCPTAIGASVLSAQAVIDTAKTAGKQILANWLGAKTAIESEKLFVAAGIPHFSTPDQAARAFSYVIRYRQSLARLSEASEQNLTDFIPLREKTRTIIDEAKKRNISWMSGSEVGEILSCYGISMPASALVSDVGGIRHAANRLNGPLVLKIQSQDIVHKSDVGGVVMGLKDGIQAEKAAHCMLANIAKMLPNAKIEGFFLQETVAVAKGIELITGMTTDPTFGPVMLFGRGGKAVEVIRDKSLSLAPLNLTQAHDMIHATRVFHELSGYRDQPPMDMDAIAKILVRLSHLVVDFPDIAEMEINPLLATENGMIAIDARLRLVTRN